MAIRSVQEADVSGKRVLVRVDFNVPMRDGEITDDTRITGALPTIRYLLDRDAAVIPLTSLAGPKGKPSPKFSLSRVAERIKTLLDSRVRLAKDVVGEDPQSAAPTLPPADVLLLENVR